MTINGGRDCDRLPALVLNKAAVNLAVVVQLVLAMVPALPL